MKKVSLLVLAFVSVSYYGCGNTGVAFYSVNNKQPDATRQTPVAIVNDPPGKDYVFEGYVAAASMVQSTSALSALLGPEAAKYGCDAIVMQGESSSSYDRKSQTMYSMTH